jgi:protein arginine kinase activator
MQCDRCNVVSATVHFTHFHDGKLQKLDLCADCAQVTEQLQQGNLSLIEMLVRQEPKTEVIGAMQAESPAPHPEAIGPESASCPECGFAVEDFQKTGRLGCPTCYIAFAEPLKGTLKSIQKGAQHRGRVPARVRDRQRREARRAAIMLELRAAIDNEAFAEATRLHRLLGEMDLGA